MGPREHSTSPSPPTPLWLATFPSLGTRECMRRLLLPVLVKSFGNLSLMIYTCNVFGRGIFEGRILFGLQLRSCICIYLYILTNVSVVNDIWFWSLAPPLSGVDRYLLSYRLRPMSVLFCDTSYFHSLDYDVCCRSSLESLRFGWELESLLSGIVSV